MFKKTDRENVGKQELPDQDEVTFVFEPIADETLKSITGGCSHVGNCQSGSQEGEVH